MARGLTIAALAIAVLMLVLFGLDLAIQVPFGRQSMLLDISFVVCGLDMLKFFLQSSGFCRQQPHLVS